MAAWCLVRSGFLSSCDMKSKAILPLSQNFGFGRSPKQQHLRPSSEVQKPSRCASPLGPPERAFRASPAISGCPASLVLKTSVNGEGLKFEFLSFL